LGSGTWKHLAHSWGECKAHIVFLPKDSCAASFAELRNVWREIFPDRALQKECRLSAGHVRLDQVHMGVAIPPPHAVASVSGFLKGKSVLASA